jgi:hypothetical protein
MKGRSDEPPVEGEAPVEGRGRPAEGKSVRGRWDAAKHPRDKHGRFAHIGDSVSLDGGGHGKITGIGSNGKVTVRKADGATVEIDAKKVTKTGSGGGGAPKAPSAPTSPSATPPSGTASRSAPAPSGTAGRADTSPSSGTAAPSGTAGRSATAAVDAVSAGNDGGQQDNGSGSQSGGPHAGLSDDDLSKAMQSAAPGPEFDALYEEATHRADSYASDLLGHLTEIEPDITSTLTGMADKYGGRMEGLDFRLKAQDSLTRKIRDKSLVSGKPMPVVRDKIGDALRYTMILDEDHYAEGTAAALRDFEAQGMTIIDQDNSWHPGNVYQGVNSVVRTPDGFMFELQFHTQPSFDTKMSTHTDYELARDPKATLAERLAAWDRMSQLQGKVPVPPNVGMVGIQRVYAPPSAKSMYDTMRLEEKKGGGEMAPKQPGRAGAKKFYALHLLGDPEPFAVAAKSASGAPERWVPGQGWVDMPAIADYFTGEDPGAREITPEEAHGYMESGLGTLGEGAVERLRGAK